MNAARNKESGRRAIVLDSVKWTIFKGKRNEKRIGTEEPCFMRRARQLELPRIKEEERHQGAKRAESATRHRERQMRGSKKRNVKEEGDQKGDHGRMTTAAELRKENTSGIGDRACKRKKGDGLNRWERV